MARACLSAIFRGPRLGLAGRRWGSYAPGHADLVGNVFNAVYPSPGDGASTLDGTRASWSRSGSWQGHTIPWSPKGSWLNVPANYKYWAMGGHCTR